VPKKSDFFDLRHFAPDFQNSELSINRSGILKAI
jgi:hypothetical protein